LKNILLKNQLNKSVLIQTTSRHTFK